MPAAEKTAKDEGSSAAGAAPIAPVQAGPTASAMRWARYGRDAIGTVEDDWQVVAYLDEHRNRRPWTDAERDAHARLIAAAPDLLAICREFIDALGPGGYHTVPGAPATARMRAAIKRATEG